MKSLHLYIALCVVAQILLVVWIYAALLDSAQTHASPEGWEASNGKGERVPGPIVRGPASGPP